MTRSISATSHHDSPYVPSSPSILRASNPAASNRPCRRPHAQTRPITQRKGPDGSLNVLADERPRPVSAQCFPCPSLHMSSPSFFDSCEWTLGTFDEHPSIRRRPPARQLLLRPAPTFSSQVLAHLPWPYFSDLFFLLAIRVVLWRLSFPATADCSLRSGKSIAPTTTYSVYKCPTYPHQDLAQVPTYLTQGVTSTLIIRKTPKTRKIVVYD